MVAMSDLLKSNIALRFCNTIIETRKGIEEAVDSCDKITALANIPLNLLGLKESDGISAAYGLPCDFKSSSRVGSETKCQAELQAFLSTAYCLDCHSKSGDCCVVSSPCECYSKDGGSLGG